MKNNLFRIPTIQWILLLLALTVLACGKFQLGLEGTATPGQDLPATITALQTEKAQLAGQLEQATALPTATSTATTLPPPTASATSTSSPTPFPATSTPTPSPDQAVSQATSPPASATPTPAASQWRVQSLLAFPGVSGRLYVLQQQVGPPPSMRLLTSDDFGQSWAAFPGALPVEAACFHRLNLDYAHLDALYANTCQGLYRWTGAAWQRISAQETGMVAIIYSQSNRVWATLPPGPSDSPVLYSDNSGESWVPASRYLSQADGVAALAFDAQNTNILYAVIWPEYAGSYLRRTIGNGQWETLPTPRNNAPIDTGFTLDGNKNALYIVSEGEGNQLWRSPNPAAADANTLRWERVHDFGPDIQVELLASGWSAQGMALYANLTRAGQSILHRSEDEGQTWTPLAIEF